MVPRYSRPAMTAIWEPEARYRIWFEIEAHATDKLGELGVVPTSAGKVLWDWWATNPKIDVAAIDAIEAVTKHDVIAFLTWVADQVGEHSGGDQARFMHQGMTSSDVLDTTLNLQLVHAADLLLADLDAHCWRRSSVARSSINTPLRSVAATASTPSRPLSG